MDRITHMPIAVPRVQPLKRSGRLFFVVLVLGLLLRLVFLYTTQSTGLMIEDERHYHHLALNLLHGHGFGWTPETPTSIRPLLYPFSEVLVWKITGTESLLYVRLAQIGLSLLTVYLLYRLGLLVFDQSIARLAAVSVWLYLSLVAFN